MAQVTAKSAIEALAWIDSHAHHECGHEPLPESTHVFFRGHDDKLRVPIKAAWYREFWTMIRPNKRAFDTRMYAVTRKGKRLLREAATTTA